MKTKKKCTLCGKVKLAKNFYKQQKGLAGRCKVCFIVSGKIYRLKNYEARKEADRQYYWKDVEKSRIRNKKWQSNYFNRNKERVNLIVKIRYHCERLSLPIPVTKRPIKVKQLKKLFYAYKNL